MNVSCCSCLLASHESLKPQRQPHATLSALSLSLPLSPSLSLTALRAPFHGAASCFVCHRAKQVCDEQCRLVRVW